MTLIECDVILKGMLFWLSPFPSLVEVKSPTVNLWVGTDTVARTADLMETHVNSLKGLGSEFGTTDKHSYMN